MGDKTFSRREMEIAGDFVDQQMAKGLQDDYVDKQNYNMFFYQLSM